MVAQKEMLPQSTERIVEVQGTPEGIEGKGEGERHCCLNVQGWKISVEIFGRKSGC